MKRFVREYRVEILAGGVVLLGIFLLVEPFDLRVTLKAALTTLANYWQNAGSSQVSSWIATLIGTFRTLSLSDIIGAVCIGLAILFVIWRIRYRFVTMERFLPINCPRCGSPVERIHRSALDRFLGKVFLPHSRRYGCTSETCTWNGLRVHGHRHSRMSGIRPTP